MEGYWRIWNLDGDNIILGLALIIGGFHLYDLCVMILATYLPHVLLGHKTIDGIPFRLIHVLD